MKTMMPERNPVIAPILMQRFMGSDSRCPNYDFEAMRYSENQLNRSVEKGRSHAIHNRVPKPV